MTIDGKLTSHKTKGHNNGRVFDDFLGRKNSCQTRSCQGVSFISFSTQQRNIEKKAMSIDTSEPIERHSYQNDVAIDLLQRDCYRQSFATFQAALNRKDGGSPPTSPRKRSTSFDSSFEPFPQPPAVKCQDLLIADLRTTDELLEILQGDDENKEVCVAIRLASYEADLPCKLFAKIMSNAIIMFNLGVARQTYAQALSNQRRNEQSTVQLEEAARLFEASESSLKGLEAPSAILRHKVLILRMLVLLALHKQSPAGSKCSRRVERKLSRIHTKISHVYRRLSSPENCAVPEEARGQPGARQSRSQLLLCREPGHKEYGLSNPAA